VVRSGESPQRLSAWAFSSTGNPVEAVRERTLDAGVSAEARNQGRRHGLGLGELGHLRGPHEALLQVRLAA
jgi:hypothetical protein